MSQNSPSDPQPSGEESTVVDTNKAEIRYNRRTGKEYVNQYELRRKLGQGAYGTVFLTLDTEINPPRKAALKVMNTKQLIKKKGSDSAAHSVLQGLFFFRSPVHFYSISKDLKREIAIMKKLNHPNVVKLYEVIDDPQSENIYLGSPFVHFSSIFLTFTSFLSYGVLFWWYMLWKK